MKHNRKSTLKQRLCKHKYEVESRCDHDYDKYYDGWYEVLWRCNKCGSRIHVTHSRD